MAVRKKQIREIAISGQDPAPNVIFLFSES